LWSKTLATRDQQPDQIIDFILNLFAHRGAEEYMGEAVTMSQHMEQSADIGHFIGGHPIEALENGIDNVHEEAGARYLEPFFPASITEPIRLHVAAKRYLCSTDKDYFSQLSDASVNSLKVQGGPMSPAEVEHFEANPYHKQAVQLRLYDDDGKIAGLEIKPVTDYRATLEAFVSN
jgi:predicted HD phosphohydrolase